MDDNRLYSTAVVRGDQPSELPDVNATKQNKQTSKQTNKQANTQKQSIKQIIK